MDKKTNFFFLTFLKVGENLKITLYARIDPAKALVDATELAPSSAKDTVADLSDKLTVSDNLSDENENFLRGWTSTPTSSRLFFDF